MVRKVSMLTPLLKKYNVPIWLEPYVSDYVSADPINAIKRATSFIDVKRKKGVVTNSYVKLPNNTTFQMDTVVRILSLFYYGEAECARIAREWVSKPDPTERECALQLAEMADMYEKRLRATKNLMDGMGYKPIEPTKEVNEVFEYLESLEKWPERMVSMNVLFRQAYGSTFGATFYKAFYAVMPEFMRSFGKVFDGTSDAAARGEAIATDMVRQNRIPNERLLEIAEELLSRIQRSLRAEMPLAEQAGIKHEAELLRRISLVYPLHTLSELGVPVDLDKEEKIITSKSKAKK